MKRKMMDAVKQLLYVMLLAWGVMFVSVWTEFRDQLWLLILILLPITFWGNWTWKKLEKKNSDSQDLYIRKSYDTGQEVLFTIRNAENVSPEVLKEILEKIRLYDPM